jgi:hypothetical protein
MMNNCQHSLQAHPVVQLYGCGNYECGNYDCWYLPVFGGSRISTSTYDHQGFRVEQMHHVDARASDPTQ